MIESIFHNKRATYLLIGLVLLGLISCHSQEPEPSARNNFYFGADLSYTNQVEDLGGSYFDDSGEEADPYQILATKGLNLARFRLWHDPQWTKEVYGTNGLFGPYSDIKDVIRSMTRAKEQGMDLLVDFHYSDFWADPGRQQIPAAYHEITDLKVLADSVEQYTLKTLSKLSAQGLSPKYVQIGNEINCGLFITDRPANFPNCNVCEGNWSQAGTVLNAAITAVRQTNPDTKIILHVADPVNVEWWFGQMTTSGVVVDFDIIGISYYPLWHTGSSLSSIDQTIEGFREQFQKDVMILETAYPWTTEDADNYGNILGGSPLEGYPFTEEGQLDFMTFLTQKAIDAGALGVIYWEPGWISSDLRDPWGQGSSWDNVTFFDFEGRSLPVVDFPMFPYQFE
ncbi:MAG: glycosyl hydrolase 53 family protein [Cytophagales bacterium]|nr:glycosyl hydrolase 53 family protein [Cytophagales bacterium]